MKLALALTISVFAAVGCSSSSSDEDASLNNDADAGVLEQSDATVLADAETADAFEADAAIEDASAPDATTTLDATVPRPGFGTISGTCGVLDDELTSPMPSFFANRIDFMADGYDDADYSLLTAGGQEMIDDGNAGGSSLLSEVFSFEMLTRCEGAVLLKTETEIIYTDPMGKLTDILVELDGMKIGVSVTRAVIFPFDQPYTVERAKELLEQKLQGILDSTANVSPQDAWVKQILYVIAYGEQHAMAIETALAQVDPALVEDTIVMVTTSDGDDAFIY